MRGVVFIKVMVHNKELNESIEKSKMNIASSTSTPEKTKKKPKGIEKKVDPKKQAGKKEVKK